MKKFRKPISALHSFFFEEIGAETLCLFRAAFGSFLIIQFLLLGPKIPLYFGQNGPIPIDAVTSNYGPYAWTLLSYIQTPGGLMLFYIATLLVTACLAAGIGTRLSTILTYICFLSWHRGALFIWNGGDLVISTLLFHLSLAGLAGHSNRMFSVDALLCKRAGKKLQTAHPAWSLRLLQLQLCFIYFFSGWYKTQQQFWQSGSSMHYVIQQLYWADVDMTPLLHTPAIVALISYVVLFFELGFPFLVWVPKLRVPMIYGVALLHGSIWLLMRVFTFTVMIVLAMVFIRPEAIRAKIESLRKRRIQPTLALSY